MKAVCLSDQLPKVQLGGPRHLAQRLGMGRTDLDRLADRADRFYRPFEQPKHGGGTRRIDQPVGEMKTVQKLLNTRVLAPLLDSPIAFGGVPGRAHTDVYAMHVGKEVVAGVDIQDFFPSVTNRHVFQLMEAIGMVPPTASLVTRLLTYEHRLPQGSPASTTIANLLLHDLDREAHDSARAHGATVTRVVDDIQISGTEHGVNIVRDAVIKGIHRLGLRVHRRKLIASRNDVRQTVRNVNVNTQPSLPRSRRSGVRSGLCWDELRAAVHRSENAGLGAAGRFSLLGKLSYARQFNARKADQLIVRLRAAPDPTLEVAV